MRLGALSLPVPASDDARIEAAVRAVDADLVVLPEAALPGYAHRLADASARARALAARVPVVVGFLDGVGSAAGVQGRDGFVAYRKRFLAPAEARVWGAGREAVVAETAVGRLGLLVCADVLQVQAWEDLRGKVDAVAICAAWPHYRDRRFAALYAGIVPYRDAWLAQAAAALGVPVVFADATGRGFGGRCGLWDADGRRVAEGAVVTGDVAPGRPGAPLRHPPGWAAFTRVYRGVARGVERLA